jgi:transposase
MRQLRRKEPEQFDRLSFAPGEEMQVDYGEGAPTRVPGTERWRKPRLFVATLRYSRRSFRRVVWKSSQQIWAELHEQAWAYFGGSCRYAVLDNLKEGVLKSDLYESRRSIRSTPPRWRTTRWCGQGGGLPGQELPLGGGRCPHRLHNRIVIIRPVLPGAV